MQARSTLTPFTLFSWFGALLLTLLVSACGGGESAPSPAASNRLMGASTIAVTAVAADYKTVAQRMYVAYYGRPADPAGLVNLQTQLLIANAPVTVDALSTAYNNNPTLRVLIDSFGNSAESQLLYSGDNPRFVIAVYNHLLNRDPALAGLQFWTDGLNNGLQRGNAALSIMAAALANTSSQGLADTVLISKKMAIADLFSAAVPASAYRGQSAAGIARNMLSMVSADTDLAAFQSTIDEAIDSVKKLNVSTFAGDYSGTYSGADSGTFSVSISTSGAISGTGQSSSGPALIITGTLAVGGAIDMKATGSAGDSGFTGGIDPATGTLSGTWDAGVYGKGTFTGSKAN
jgi:hypothetical protein